MKTEYIIKGIGFDIHFHTKEAVANYIKNSMNSQGKKNLCDMLPIDCDNCPLNKTNCCDKGEKLTDIEIYDLIDNILKEK